MPNTKKVNWNTLLLSAGFAMMTWLGKETYSEMRSTHDAVLIIKAQMVSHAEFDLQISEVRSRLTSVETDILKLKERNLIIK